MRAAHHLLGLAPSGVYLANYIAAIAGGLLHHRFTLTSHANFLANWRFAFCCTFPRIAPGGRYPPLCSSESGLSSVLKS